MLGVRLSSTAEAAEWTRMREARAAEAWGRAGLHEFPSDGLIENGISAAAHKALGFDETARIRYFRKDL